jgi:hypothetical protein
MHIENELVEFMTAGEREYDKVIEEYKKEVLIQEEFLEPPMTDTADTTPTQGKPQCITRILIIKIYICCAFTLQEFYDTHVHIYIYIPKSLTIVGSRSGFA